MPNLTPLLAMLLAREGVPVLMHGLLNDPGRVTSAEILQLLGIQPVTQQDDRNDVVLRSFEQRQPVFFLFSGLPLAYVACWRCVAYWACVIQRIHW